MQVVCFKIPMLPRGQGRAKATSIGGMARMYKAKKDVQHETTLAALAHPFRPKDALGNLLVLDGALSVSVTVLLPRPQALCGLGKKSGQPLQDPGRRWHTGKPDADNCLKAVLDALKAFWRDDAVVASAYVEKFVAGLNEAPGYVIRIGREHTPGTEKNRDGSYARDEHGQWIENMPF